MNVAQRLDRRMLLASLPTPLMPMPRLAAKIGFDFFWTKRDDLTDFAGTGNKLRKLEFLLQEALQQGARAVVTHGRLQSNHARATAVAAAKLGLRCIILYQAEKPAALSGNCALAALCGAELHFAPGTDMFAVNGRIRGFVQDCKSAGTSCYAIPEGGGDPVGALGFVAAAKEIAEQCEARSISPEVVLIGVGSAGSLAGLALGLRLFSPQIAVIGVSVGPPVESLGRRAAQIANGAARLLEVNERFTPADFVIYGGAAGDGYGLPSPASDALVSDCARLEGILLDPAYTAKVMLAAQKLSAHR